MSKSCVNPSDRDIKRMESKVDASAGIIAGLAEANPVVDDALATAKQRYGEAVETLKEKSDFFDNLLKSYITNPDYITQNGFGLNGLGKQKLTDAIIESLESDNENSEGTWIIQSMIDTGIAPLRIFKNASLYDAFKEARKYFIKSALTVHFSPSRVIAKYRKDRDEKIREDYFEDINDTFIDNFTDEEGGTKLDVSYLAGIAEDFVDANNMTIDYFLDVLLPRLDTTYKFSFRPAKSLKNEDKRAKFAKTIKVNDLVYRSYNKQGEKTSGIIDDIKNGRVTQYTLSSVDINSIGKLKNASDRDIFKLVDENNNEVFVSLKGGIDFLYRDPSQEYQNVRRMLPETMSIENLVTFTSDNPFGYDFVNLNKASKKVLWDSWLTQDEINDVVDYIARAFHSNYKNGEDPDDYLRVNGKIFASTKNFTNKKKASFVFKVQERDVWENLVRLAKNKIEYMSNIHLVENKQQDEDMAEDEMSEMPKESWMWKAMERDPRTSLSETTRVILNNIPKVTRNKDGKYVTVTSNLVNTELQYIDANVAHRYLQEHLMSSGTLGNMISRMRRLSITEPWVGFLLDKLLSDTENPYDINSFFSDFNKEFLGIMKVSLDKHQSYILNKKTATEYLMSNLKDTLSSSNTHNKVTLWNDKYLITSAKLNAFKNLHDKIATSIEQTFPKGGVHRVGTLEAWARKNIKDIKRSLDYLGFTLSTDDIVNSFLSGSIVSKEDPTILQSTGFGYVFNRFESALQKAYDKINKIVITTETGNVNFNPNDFYNTTLFYPYNELSKIFQYSVESPIQSSFTNNGKSMYSMINPSYMSRMMTELCDESLSIEERRALIKSKFGYSFWFSDNENTGRYYNVFLDMLANPRLGNYEYERLAENLKTFSTIKFADSRDFEDLGNLDREIACISAYQYSIDMRDNNKNEKDRFAPFMLPALSDAPNKVMSGINFSMDEIVSHTIDMIRQEYNRINVIKEIVASNPKFEVQDYFKRGQHFVNLQALESFRIGNKTFYDALTAAKKIKDSVKIYNILKQGAQHVLYNIVQNYVTKGERIGLFDSESNRFTNLPNSFVAVDELKGIKAAYELYNQNKKNAKNIEDVYEGRNLPKYILNTWLNTRQLMQLFIIDDAFYADSIDQTKRIKEITAPVQSPSVIDDMKDMVSLRVEDLKNFESDTSAGAKALIKKFAAAKLISQSKAKQLIKEWEEGYNVTDGQTVIGAHTMQNILKAYGNYDSVTMDPIFNKLMAGQKLDTKEQFTFFQTLKPFYFSNEKVTYTVQSKEKDPLGNPIEEAYSFPVPTQYKNSEFMVAAVGLMTQNPVFIAFRDILDGNALGTRVDKIDFNSTVKHSNFAYITGIKDILAEHKGESPAAIKNAIIKHIQAQVAEGGNNIAQNKYFHSTPTSDYGISNSVPEHFADQSRALGSQVLRHAFSNVPDHVPFNMNTVGAKPITEININGKKVKLSKPNTLSRQQYTQLLSELLAQNLFDDDAKFHETLIDGNDIVQWIYDSAKKSDILTSEQIRALTPVADEFGNLRPLVSYNAPAHTIKVQQLINSAFKKRVISQGTRGGMLVQTSAFGFTDDLNVRYRDNNGNIIPTFNEWKQKNPDLTRKDYDAYVETLGVSSIDYMEAYLPVWSKKMIEDLMDDNGFLDINKKTADGKYIIPESIRNLFAYRIPTEDTYSVVPIRVKGFLNNTTGSNIFLPAEITLITGSDFDIDKMFIALYAITKQKDGTYAKTEYDYSKPSYQQYADKAKERDARTNAIIDLMYSKYTTPEAALEYVNPSSFDDMKKFAYVHRLTKEHYAPYSKLLSMDLNSLKKIVKDLDSGRDIYDPMERTLQMGRNILGGQMIGIFAVNRVFHSSLQNYNAIHTDAPMYLLDASEKNPVFNLSFDYKNEPPKRILGQKYNDNGKLTSYIFGSAVSSATDSVKDPVLEDLNLNNLTAPLYELLISLGYDEELVYLYLNQPLMINAVREYQRNPYSTLSQLLANQINKYASILYAGEANSTTASTVSQVIGNDLAVKDVYRWNKNNRDALESALAYDETTYKLRADEGQSFSPAQMMDYYSFAFTQLKAANMLMKVAKYASLFNEGSLTSRPDSRGASVGPNQLDNIQRIKRLQKYNEDSTRLIANGQVVTLGLRNLRKRDMMTAIIESPFPVSQMYTTLGLESMAEIENRIFSYSSPLYQKAYDMLADNLGMDVLPKKLALSLMEDLLAYLSTTNTGFGDVNYENYWNKLKYFVQYDQFHKDFTKFKAKYVGTTATASVEDGVNITKDSSFLNALNYYKKRNRIFLNDTMRTSDRFTHEWRELYYAKVPVSEKYPEGYNPELRDMAMKLYMYNFFYNGMGFGSNTFHKYAPVEMQLAIRGYNQLLDSIPKIELDSTSESMAVSFLQQYSLRNATDFRVAEQFVKKRFKEGEDYLFFDNGQYLVRTFSKPQYEGQSIRKPKQVVRDVATQELYLMVANDASSPLVKEHFDELNKLEESGRDIKIYQIVHSNWWTMPELMFYYNTSNPEHIFGSGIKAPKMHDDTLFSESEASDIEAADLNRANPEGQFESLSEDDYIPSHFNDADNEAGVPTSFSDVEEINDPAYFATIWEQERQQLEELNGANPRDVEFENYSAADLSAMEEADEKGQENKTLNSIGEIQHKYSETLNTRIRQLCEQYNIPVSALTELDKRLQLNGIMEVQRADAVADMFTVAIRVAKGEVGEAALPEEFAHAIIAMLEGNPLHDRLMNVINLDTIQEVLGDNYDRYVDLYGGDIKMLTEETAGQLLAEAFRRVNDNPVKTSIIARFNNIFNRIKDFFRRIFGRFNSNDFEHAQAQATDLYNQLASDILGGKIQFNNAMVSSNNRIRSLYATTAEDINKKEKLLRKIIEKETEKIEIFKKRKIGSSSAEVRTSNDLIDALSNDLKKNMFQHGVTTFLGTTLNQLKYYTEEIKKYNKAELTDRNIRAISRNIRMMKDLYSSFNDIIKEIREETLNTDLTDQDWADIKSMADNVKNALDYLQILYNQMAKKLFIATLNPLFKGARKVTRGKNQGRELTDEDIYEKVDRDITGMDLWVDSMANSSNLMLRGVDMFVKQQKDAIRLKVLEHRRKLETLYSRAKNAGIKSFDYMFQRDENGNLTGNFIMQIDYKKYSDAYKAQKEKWLKQYGDERSLEYQRAKNEWLADNYNKAHHEPRTDKYGSEAYKRMEKDTSEQGKLKFELYKEILAFKLKLDSMLPEEYRHQYRAPQIRKDLIERLKDSGDAKSGLAALGESIKDIFVIREDDVDYGVKNVKSDFSGKEIEALPIYFVDFLKNKNDLSTDIISTMLAYANMAEYFNGMNNIIDLLEVGRDVVSEMKTPKRKGNKIMKTIIKNGDNTVVEKDVLVSAKHVIDKYNDFLTSQVYKKFYKDEGTIGNTKISVSKVGNSLISLTAINNLALNLISGISNVTTGNLQMWTEALAGTIVKNGAPFNMKAVRNADKEYFKSLGGFLGDIGARVKQSKLALWDEYFDVLLEFNNDIAEANYDRNRFGKMFSSSALFFFNTGGEHWMQNRTSLALAYSYPMIDKNGKATNLWDAMEVKKEYDKNGKLLTARLVVKDGYRKADGTEFTSEDFHKFKAKTASINHDMHGIYNKDDQSKMQTVVWGRMVMLFRRWMKPFWNRRWAGLGQDVEYDVETGEYDEGYYVTVGRFVAQAIKEIRAGQFSMTAFKDSMTAQDRANIVKAAFEMMCIAITTLLANHIEWPDKKHSTWALNMTELQVKRLLTEIGCMSPTHLVGQEFLNIAKSPTACADYLERMLKVFNVTHYGEVIQSGRYKGHTRGYKYWMDILPMNRTIFKVLNPSEATKYYNQK